MTSSGLARPRSLRSVRKPAQASADSPVPGARPMKAGLPLVVMPQAASTGSAGEPGCIRMHPGSPAEPVLAAWGITTSGKPAFIGLAPGTGESADAWAGFLTDLKDRGLASPLLVISDGAPGLIAAIEQAYPKALRQRCLIHRCRNIIAKV